IGDISLGGGMITVPDSADQGVSFSSPTGSSLAVTPLSEKEWGRPLLMDDGGVTYLNDEGFAETVIVGEDSVQMLTTILDASAPTEYRYRIEMQAGQKLQMVDSGPVVVSGNGDVDLIVRAPWAIDSHGNSVPTRFEVEGDVLTQIVDHHTLSADSYPVVADPVMVPAWLFRCLVGLGINSASIIQSAQMGSFWGVFAKAIWHCVRGR
ncbi:hypothetical protein, partial [Arcanobacterium phocae]